MECRGPRTQGMHPHAKCSHHHMPSRQMTWLLFACWTSCRRPNDNQPMQLESGPSSWQQGAPEQHRHSCMYTWHAHVQGCSSRRCKAGSPPVHTATPQQAGGCGRAGPCSCSIQQPSMWKTCCCCVVPGVCEACGRRLKTPSCMVCRPGLAAVVPGTAAPPNQKPSNQRPPPHRRQACDTITTSSTHQHHNLLHPPTCDHTTNISTTHTPKPAPAAGTQVQAAAHLLYSYMAHTSCASPDLQQPAAVTISLRDTVRPALFHWLRAGRA